MAIVAEVNMVDFGKKSHPAEPAASWSNHMRAVFINV